MSPTEDELRTALSDGAGDVPNVDRIVFAAKERRVQRRRTALSVAGAVVLVGALGGGGTYLVQHGSTSGSADASGGIAHAPQDYAAGSNTTAAADGGANSGVASGAGAHPDATCPSHVPNTLLPGGGGTNEFGSTGKLFAQPVGTVTVCAYPAAEGTTTQLRLSGSDASTLVDSLETAPRSRPGGVCSDLRMADQTSLAIIATAKDGKTLPTVTTTINEPSCAVVVTNGTVVRYAWSPPLSLSPELRALQGATAGVGEVPGSGSATTVSPPGHIHGSPVH